MKQQRNKQHHYTKEYVYYVEIPYVDYYGYTDNDVVYFHRLSKAIDYIKEMPMRYDYEIVDCIFKFEITFCNGEYHCRPCNFIYRRNKQGVWYRTKNISLHLSTYLDESSEYLRDDYPKLKYED